MSDRRQHDAHRADRFHQRDVKAALRRSMSQGKTCKPWAATRATDPPKAPHATAASQQPTEQKGPT